MESEENDTLVSEVKRMMIRIKSLKRTCKNSKNPKSIKN
jgi:hypothetical protein